MRTHPSNRDENTLPPGLDEQALLQAIRSSGYPLQGITAYKLQQDFRVREEWAYVERDSKDHRRLDVFAYKSLTPHEDAKISPRLAVLVECKRSVHPYVFFQSVTRRTAPGFPRIAGLKRGHVSVRQRDGRRTLEAPGSIALGLRDLEFADPGPPCCCAFSRAEMSGSKVSLSGAQPFNALVQPLVSASEHTAEMHRAAERPGRLFPTLVLSLGVLDAPMILVEDPAKEAVPVLAPWVRLLYEETAPARPGGARYKSYALDIVHISFLDAYVADHLLPFSQAFAERASASGDVLLQGGVVDDLDKWDWRDIMPADDKEK